MPRIPLLDVLHRGVVYSLAGLSVWAIVSSVAVHRNTIRSGREYMERKEAEQRQQREEAMGPVSEAIEHHTVKRP
ncbi:hypothetical protein E1B28_010304 [Marasmius oreades]|uniref:Uncharacterized protein n=1 Tax=Marasmius oreades TaxID=181124 RepID=A0A9P7RXI1_9AGAR|nr:uncharacterized protein E1B28_010304 [Marasmius oreades]KAG7091255.1 hypothetical protein E1B28_010304 [Marasmius oreades]